MRIEVTVHTLPAILAEHLAELPRGVVSKAEGYYALNNPVAYTRDGSALMKALFVAQLHFKVDDDFFRPLEAFNHVCILAEREGIPPGDMVTAGIYTSYAFSKRNDIPAPPRTWFKALKKLGYKVYLCN